MKQHKLQFPIINNINMGMWHKCDIRATPVQQCKIFKFCVIYLPKVCNCRANYIVKTTQSSMKSNNICIYLEDYYLLGCDTMWSGKPLRTFQRNMLVQSSVNGINLNILKYRNFHFHSVRFRLVVQTTAHLPVHLGRTWSHSITICYVRLH
jgi:hypothetical protein